MYGICKNGGPESHKRLQSVLNFGAPVVSDRKKMKSHHDINDVIKEQN